MTASSDHTILSTRRLAVPTTEGYVFVPIASILCGQALGHYTRFLLTGGSSLVSSYTLRYFEELLAPRGFVRVHKSHLVNLLHTTRYLRQGIVELTDGSRIAVARGCRPVFLEAMKRHFET